MTNETKGETMTTKTISDFIRERGLGCEDAARMQGWTVAAGGYDLTEEDCDFIVDSVRERYGKCPTRQDWVDAGYEYVGGKHCEDEQPMSHSEQSDWAALVETMDDDLREQVHSELAPCSMPAFAERYAELHIERHGVKWPEPGMPAIPGTL